MTKLSLSVAAAALFALSSCGPGDGYDHYGAYDTLKQQLRDPGSAQFSDQEEYEHAGWKAYCGNVNSKNGFGGYSGPTPFAILQKKNGGSVAVIARSSAIAETIQSAINRACTPDTNMPFVPETNTTSSNSTAPS